MRACVCVSERERRCKRREKRAIKEKREQKDDTSEKGGLNKNEKKGEITAKSERGEKRMERERTSIRRGVQRGEYLHARSLHFPVQGEVRTDLPSYFENASPCIIRMRKHTQRYM